jgi:4-oxalocrotonate tautomerase
MPFVNMRTLKGLLTEEQKRTLQHRLTDAVVEVAGKGDPAYRDHVWVLIEEDEPLSWCVGGVNGADIIAARARAKQA